MGKAYFWWTISRQPKWLSLKIKKKTQQAWKYLRTAYFNYIGPILFNMSKYIRPERKPTSARLSQDQVPARKIWFSIV